MSKTALEHLTAQYTDSENEDTNSPDISKTNKIEDENGVNRGSGHDHQHHHHHHQHQHDYRPQVSTIGSGQGAPGTTRTLEPPESIAKKAKTSQKALRRKLVSYIENIMHSDDDDNDSDDDDDDDDEDDDQDDDEPEDNENANGSVPGEQNRTRNSGQRGGGGAESGENAALMDSHSHPDNGLQNQGDLKYAKYAHYGFSLPPEPKNKQPLPELVEKIEQLYEKMNTQGMDMNEVIQRRKEFRNPSIYVKLIQFCDINELGTNYPPEIYDPLQWGAESYYDELDRVQIKEMEKRRKERKDKDKIEQVSALARKVEEEAKKRKSKWDQPAPSVKQGYQGHTLTTTVTGTKGTVISAFGSLPKKFQPQ